MAAPTPIANVSNNKAQEVDIPARVNVPSKQAASSIHPCVKRSRRRRSTISARAPAGRASKKAGKLDADCINATIIGEAETELISQAAPTFCIQVPIFDANKPSIFCERRDDATGSRLKEIPVLHWLKEIQEESRVVFCESAQRLLTEFLTLT